MGSKAEVQDDSKHIAEADQTTKKPAAIHFRHGCGYSAVKEEITDTNTKTIERIKIG